MVALQRPDRSSFRPPSDTSLQNPPRCTNRFRWFVLQAPTIYAATQPAKPNCWGFHPPVERFVKGLWAALHRILTDDGTPCQEELSHSKPVSSTYATCRCPSASQHWARLWPPVPPPSPRPLRSNSLSWRSFQHSCRALSRFAPSARFLSSSASGRSMNLVSLRSLWRRFAGVGLSYQARCCPPRYRRGAGAGTRLSPRLPPTHPKPPDPHSP